MKTVQFNDTLNQIYIVPNNMKTIIKIMRVSMYRKARSMGRSDNPEVDEWIVYYNTHSA